MIVDSRPKTSPYVIDYRLGAGNCTDVGTYDWVRYRSTRGRYKQAVMRSVYLQMLGSLEGKRILDVATGTGRGAIEFSHRAAFVVACDASADMIAAAKSNEHDPTKLAFVAGLAQDLPISNETFDVVTALNFLHLFSADAQRAFVKEMARVLRPGGFLLLELDNALSAFGLGLLRKWLAGEHRSTPSEIRSLLPEGCRLEQRRDALITYVWRILCYVPKFGFALERIAESPLIGRFVCTRCYILICKSS
jgi:ubiquinone/menaquinone biosynthesis C-methylase UbiE